MRILFVPYGTDKAPATRYRVMQYLAPLAELGIDCRVFSAISKPSTNLMIKSPDFAPFLKYVYYIYVSIERVFRLFYVIFIAKKFDIIFLQRTTFPLALETLLKAINNNIIFDIDDAIYLPDKPGNDFMTRVKRYIKESEVINILRVSKIVIVENEYIKNFVSRYCSSVVKIPGPIDTERFFVQHEKRDPDEVVIGWIGTPATTAYLHMLDGVLKNIKNERNSVRFRFIGLGRYENPCIEFERVDWAYETEVKNLQAFDIGIMPMPDDEWTRGKLGCKMLQYMAVGVPAIVSYTPTNAEIIKNGENGFFAAQTEEWEELLSRLIKDIKLRRDIGRSGRHSVEEMCSLRKNTMRLFEIFESLK